MIAGAGFEAGLVYKSQAPEVVSQSDCVNRYDGWMDQMKRVSTGLDVD
jgi:hypothetical protein